MPLAKTYKRYASLQSFGVIANSKCNIVMLNKCQIYTFLKISTYCISGAGENVIVWDAKKGEKIMVLKGSKAEVTSLAKTKDQKIIAVGYSDGAVRLWNLKDNTSDTTFSGHRSFISCLSFNKDGTNLVSGSTDTDIIVWDVVAEKGLFRLKGHKGMVTSCHFMKNKNILVTSSKDMFVKFWDLDTQHCFLTMVGHKSEIWQTCIFKDDTRLITGSSDSELRLYEITETNKRDEPITCNFLGAVFRQSKGRVMTLKLDSTEKYFVCQGTDDTLEVFSLPNEDEIEKAVNKRYKKALKKQQKQPESEQRNEIHVTREVSDELKCVQCFRLKQKIRSCAIHLSSNDEIKVMVMFLDNHIKYYKIDLEQSPLKCQLSSAISLAGHRSDVRALAFNSDATLMLTCAAESVKIWNRSTQKCIRTIDSEYCLCCCFVPGDKHVIIGSKFGTLQLFNISAGILLEKLKAHNEAIWSIAMIPDKSGIVSGSADHEIKFWDFELITDDEYSETSKRLSLSHTQTLKMAEEVLALKYSPDGRLLAVSLLDSTVKVFFSDTLKFFLSLYGHKFPVLCMDISQDSSLLVTGSADKNIKIWGLDFGDCHKSIFAHDDSITAIQFVSKTHYFFSTSKDKTLKYWDADRYENIMTLQGHHAEIWAMSVSAAGEFVVTSSHDKSIRLWERTEELLVIEEEREMEREEANEMAILDRGKQRLPGETEGEVEDAGKKTMETIKGAEKIIESIDIYKEETEKMQSEEDYDVHPILQAHGNISPCRYVLHVVKSIRSSELEEALLVLPFSYVIDILEIMNIWMKKEWEIELTSRCITFLLKIHQNQITSTQVLMSTLEALKNNTKKSVAIVKDQVGFNRAGLRFLQNQLELKNIKFFEEAQDNFRQKKRKSKKLVNFVA